jgi:O-acetylhomoserine (thiol)-lyase
MVLVTVIAGVACESGRFDWSSGRFPNMTDPVASYGNLRFWENFGEYAFCTKLRVEQLRDFGPAMSPFTAFLLLQGLETLALRMEIHVANAKAVAEWLAEHPAVSWVNYAGLPESPSYDLAQRYMPKGPGSVFSFGVKGGREAGATFIEAVEVASHLANIGDTRTLVIHPASTTHRQLTDEQRSAAGAGPEVVRLSIGLEDKADIIADLEQALESSE